jgi:RNA polymerase sigma-70 factor (ECF subfamily)
VVVNECLQSIRKTKRINETQHLDHLIAEDTDEDHTTDIAIGLINQFVTELNYEQQRCITEFYMKKKSYQQIAEQNNWTLKQVKSAIQNGKRNLRLKYEEHEAKNPS